MAITKEQLDVKIGIDSSAAIESLNEVTKATKVSDMQLSKLESTVKGLSKTEMEYASAIDKSAKASYISSDALGNLEKSSANLNDSIATTSSSLTGLKFSNDQLKAFEDSLAKVGGTASKLNNTLSQARDAAGKFSDGMAESAEKTEQSGNILRSVISAIEKTIMYGFTAIAGLTAFNVFKAWSSSAMSFQSILNGIEPTIKSLVTKLADSDITKIFSNIGPAISSAFGTVKDITGVAAESFKKLNLSIADVYKLLSLGGFALGSLADGLSGSTVGSLELAAALGSGSAAFLAISIAIKVALHTLGSFIESIGDKLISAMSDFEEKFAKSQQIVTQFGFVIKNFGAAYGSGFIGTLSQWEDKIKSLAGSSTFSANDIRKATKIVVAENQALGLSYEENVKFLERSVDIASSSGLELIDVVQRLQSALMGNSTAVGALGINLNSHALEHSKLNKTMQKTVGTMTSLEKQQIALAEIYRQTDPLVGAAIKQGQTIIGVNQQIANSYSSIQSKLGSVGVLSIALRSAYADLLKSAESLPDTFYSIVSSMIDITGVTFKIIGITLQWMILIGGLHTAYKLLNIAIITNVALQNTLNAIFAKLGLNLAIQTTAITNASSLFKVMGNILKGGLLIILGNVAHVIGIVTTKVLALTAAVLTNPLFLVGAGITIGIIALIKALDELNTELEVIGNMSIDFSDRFDTIKASINGFKDIISGVFNAFVQTIKIVILSFAELYQYIKLVRELLGKMFTLKPYEEYDKRIDSTLKKLDTLTAAHEKSMDSIAFGFLGANDKLALHAKYLDEAGKATDELTFKQLQLKKAADAIDMTTIKVDILGTEVEKITNKYTVAAKEAAKFSKEILDSTEINTEAVKSYQKALSDQAAAGFQLDKVRIDSLKEISKIVLDVKNNSLKNNEDETKAIIAGFDERRDAVKEFEKAIVQTGPVSTDTAAKIVAAYDSIAKAQRIAIEAAKKKKEDEGIAESLKIYKEQYQALKDIQDKNIEIEKFNKNEGLTNRDKIASDLGVELKLIEQRLEIEKATWGETSKVSEELRKQKSLLEQQAKIRTEKSPSAKYERIAKVGTDIGEGITRSFTNGFSGMLAGSASIVGSMGTAIGAITAAINALLDFIPNLLNSFAEIFNKITDFPETLFKAFQGLFDAVVRFVQEFIPKLVESIFKSFTQIKDFANNIANALDNLADQLPDIISNLIEKLPDIMVSLIENLAKAWLKILAAVYIKLPAAIIKGIIQGVSKLWEGIKRLFAGKSFLPKVKVDATDAAKKIGEKLSGASGRLFSVKDLTDAAKDPVQAMTDSIEEAFKKGTDWIKQAWMWVYEKIIQPIFAGLKAVWMYIWDNILRPIYEGFKAAFNWINDNIFKPINDALMAAFMWVNDNIFKPFIDGIMSVFVWINDNIIAPISEAFMTVFSFIDEKVIQPLLSVGQKIAQPIIDAFKGITSIFNSLGDALKSLFKLDFSGLKEAMSEVFSKGGQIVKDAFSGVVNPIIRMFNGLIDLLNAMVIPGVSWSVSAGRLGSWSGTLFDDIDLLPGTINRLQTLADGGIVKSIGSPISGFGTDTVPAMLTPGEFVMSRPAVQSIGLDNLRAMNNGSSLGGSNTYNMSFEINVEAKTSMDEGYIRGTLIPRMSEELKRASLDGKFVLSQKGIR